MKFTMTEEQISLTYTIETIGKDTIVTVGGGASHIGSVSVVFDGIITTLTAKSHKDNFLTEPLAKALANKKEQHFVVIGGFHLDDITQKQIETVLDLHKKGIKKILGLIK